MCGFVGFLNFENIIPTKEIYPMNKSIHHRGPDSEGYNYFSLSNNFISNKDIGNNNYDGVIGFRRLSIIDTSSNGDQPFVSEDGSSSIMLNGEIYNFLELKEKLINVGFKFKSKSDTEVLLKYYLHFGIDKTLNDIDGIFAFYIIDLNKKKSYLVRDRLGIKPIYYYYNKSNLIFGSEVKALISNKLIEKKINQRALAEFIIFNNLHSEYTLFENIKLIAPGSYIEISDKKIQTKSYFNYFYNKENKVNNFNYFKSLLSKNIKSQMVSDVPIATQLSGGLDSSIITHYLSVHSNKNIESLSVVFDDPKYDESKYINFISNKLKIKNHKTKMNAKIFTETLENAVWYYDFPFTTVNSIGIYELCKLAKKNFKVLLSGEGADELFLGYDRYFRFIFLSYFIKFLPKKIGYKIIKKNLIDQSNYKYFLNNIYNKVILFDEEINISKIVDNRIKVFFKNKKNFLENFIKYEIRTHLHELLLRQDKMSMANSIENRVPFLANEIIEFSASLSTNKKLIYPYFKFLRSKFSKIILKKLSFDLFGNKFTYRKKNGFSFPIDVYFNSDHFNRYFNTLLNDTNLNKKFNNLDLKEFKYLYKKNFIPPIEQSKNIFTLITFMIWLKKYNIEF